MSAYKIYRSTDSGAPRLRYNTSDADVNTVVSTNIRTNMVAILDACFVTGYGSKTGAGWTKPYSDSSSHTLYKSSSGHCIRLEPLEAATNFGAIFEYSGYGFPIKIMNTDPGSVNGSVTSNKFPFIYASSDAASATNWNGAIPYQWIVGINADSAFIMLSPDISAFHPRSLIYWLGKYSNSENGTSGVAHIGGLTNTESSYYKRTNLTALTGTPSAIGSKHSYIPSSSTFSTPLVISYGALSNTNRPSNPVSHLGSASIISDGKIRYSNLKIFNSTTKNYIGVLDDVYTFEHTVQWNHLDTVSIDGVSYICIAIRPDVDVSNEDGIGSSAEIGYYWFKYGGG